MVAGKKTCYSRASDISKNAYRHSFRCCLALFVDTITTTTAEELHTHTVGGAMRYDYRTKRDSSYNDKTERAVCSDGIDMIAITGTAPRRAPGARGK